MRILFYVVPLIMVASCASFENVEKSDPPVFLMDAGRGGVTLLDQTNAALQQDLAERLSYSIPPKVEASPMRFYFLQFEQPRSTLNEQLESGINLKPSGLVSIVIEEREDTAATGVVVYWSNKNPYGKDSKQLANAVAKQLETYALDTEKPQKIASPLLAQVQVPAITIAIGNLSNPRERQQLLSSVWREELAAAIRNSIMDYTLN